MRERMDIDIRGFALVVVCALAGAFIGASLNHGIQMKRIADALERAYPPKEAK